MRNPKYDRRFYDNQRVNSYNSARIVLTFLFGVYQPKSIVDFGCGVGTWLAAANELSGGAGEYVGIDGDWGDKRERLPTYVDYVPHDLSKPIELGKKFDLAMSLEVAEHLPATAAQQFVHTIASSSDVVLFGAAVPGQGGVGHINEQYQSYWIALFADQGFLCFDIVRPQFFSDSRVGVAYRQNAFIYIKENSSAANLFDRSALVNKTMMDVIHPTVFERYTKGVRSNRYLLRKMLRNALLRR